MEDKVIYKELSYKIVGILFEVYNDLGYGYKEGYYENAIAVSFKKEMIKYKRPAPVEIQYKDEVVGKIFLDFIIDGKIVLELKKGKHFSRKNIEQVLQYLKASGMKLAILANFTPMVSPLRGC